MFQTRGVGAPAWPLDCGESGMEGAPARCVRVVALLLTVVLVLSASLGVMSRAASGAEVPSLSAEPSTVYVGWMDEIINWNRSEEHTSELQSRLHLVCRLL